MQHDHSGYSPRRPNIAVPHRRNNSDGYLENAVRTASPARIRLLLIERGIDVAGALANKYRDPSGIRGTNEHSIHLLDLLSELLGGIAKNDHPLTAQIADLYVFLCQELVRAESDSDPRKVESIQEILRIEAETWRAVCANEQPAAILADVAGLNQSLPAGLNLRG